MCLTGDETPGEDHPFLSGSDYDRSCDGKNMALFEVQFSYLFTSYETYKC